MKYDVFISHASEDKSIANSLCEKLVDKGYKVWLDEFELTIGDSLLAAIDKGLSESRYGVVILSDIYFQKVWTNRELQALFSKELNGEKVVLPVWHNITHDQIIKWSPILADKLSVSTDSGLGNVVTQIAKVLDKNKKADNYTSKMESISNSLGIEIPNLKKITDRDKDNFMSHSFQEICQLLTQLLDDVQRQNSNFSFTFEEITKKEHVLKIYLNDYFKTGLRIWLGSDMGCRPEQIFISTNLGNTHNSFNEIITCEISNGNQLFLKLTMSFWSERKIHDTKSTVKDIWDRFILPSIK